MRSFVQPRFTVQGFLIFFFGETFPFVFFSQGLFQAYTCVVSNLCGGRVPTWHATFSFVIVHFCGHVANVARRR